MVNATLYVSTKFTDESEQARLTRRQQNWIANVEYIGYVREKTKGGVDLEAKLAEWEEKAFYNHHRPHASQTTWELER